MRRDNGGMQRRLQDWSVKKPLHGALAARAPVVNNVHGDVGRCGGHKILRLLWYSTAEAW